MDIEGGACGGRGRGVSFGIALVIITLIPETLLYQPAFIGVLNEYIHPLVLLACWRARVSIGP